MNRKIFYYIGIWYLSFALGRFGHLFVVDKDSWRFWAIFAPTALIISLAWYPSDKDE